MSILGNLSVTQLKRAIGFRQKIEALEAKLTAMLSGSGVPSPFSTIPTRRTMSPAGRRKVAAAQRLRWAKVKGESGTTEKKGRRKMSAAARAKIAAAAKARWAKVKAAGKKSL